MDLAVQEESISSEEGSGQSKDNGEASGGRTGSGGRSSAGDLSGSGFQSGENLGDEFTSALVSIVVLTNVAAQLRFALDGFFVRLLADLGNFLFLVSVVAIVVVCVSTENYNR